MNSLRILLVEGNARRAAHILGDRENTGVLAAVSTMDEAEEALSIQKFDAVLFSAEQPLEDLPAFAGRLRLAENGNDSRPQTVILVCGNESDIAFADGYLPSEFSFEELHRTVSRALERQMQQVSRDDSGAPQLAGFDRAAFEVQCEKHADLMIEIIDLFLDECKVELPEMGDALGRGDFEALSRLAHRMKGSLGSLHAPLARRRAQALESAAKAGDESLSGALLTALEDDLTALKVPLETLRDSCSRA